MRHTMPFRNKYFAIYFLGKRLVGFEFFNRSDIYIEYFDKILKSIGYTREKIAVLKKKNII